MAGLIKFMIDNIIQKRSKGNPLVANLMRNKLILSGINPDNYTFTSEDDKNVIKKLEEFAADALISAENHSIEIFHTSNTNIIEAVSQIRFSLMPINPKLVIYFASSEYDQRWLAAEMRYAFQDAQVIGSSTAGEIISGKMLENSIVAMGISENIVEKISVQVIENLSEGIDLTNAFQNFQEDLGKPVSTLDMESYAGMVLIDGVTGNEEKLMEKLGAASDLLFVGASAGDNLKFKESFVYANGYAYKDAAVLCILKPDTDFRVIKTQSFNTLDKVLTATKVNEKNREILEFNGKPAAEEYAKVLGIDIKDAPAHFITNPVGLMLDDEPYVRSPQRIIDTKMKFYCAVKEGMELHLLESDNIIRDTKDAISKVESELGSISGIINFNCILRTLELKSKGLENEYAQIFKDIPTIGFSTYGEEYLGHINQTATMLVFK